MSNGRHGLKRAKKMLKKLMRRALALNLARRKLYSTAPIFADQPLGSGVSDGLSRSPKNDSACKGIPFQSRRFTGALRIHPNAPVLLEPTITMKSSSGVLVRFSLMAIRDHPAFHAFESIYECDDPACCGCGCPVFSGRYAYLPEEVAEALLRHVEMHHAFQGS
jgi:hypothetical protein